MATGVNAGALADALNDLAAFAASLTRHSRPLARQWFRQSPAIDTKADASPVTIADQSIESSLRHIITTTYPDHGIIGEEHDNAAPDADFVWVIDPIDGTRAFACGNPLFGTLIALLYQGRPVIGIIDLPALDQQWIGIDGEPTRLNGRIVQTRDLKTLAEARLTTTSGVALGDDRPRFERLAEQVRVTGYGGDCANYAHLASGWCDLVVESHLNLYDIMAVIPVITGAGGVISQWDGAEIRHGTYDGTALASATPDLHDGVLPLLA